MPHADGLVVPGITGDPAYRQVSPVLAQHHPPDQTPPSEHILVDALRGEAMDFAREQGAEEMWRIMDPILDDATPVQICEPGPGYPRRPTGLPRRPASGTTRSGCDTRRRTHDERKH